MNYEMNDFWYAVAIGAVVGTAYSLIKFATQVDMKMTLDYLFVRRLAAQLYKLNNDPYDSRYFFQWQTLPDDTWDWYLSTVTSPEYQWWLENSKTS